MKKYSKYFVVAMSTLAFAFSTGTLIKVNATPAAAAAVPAQPVDLTYAAEKSLPSVVHILSTKNSKVQTVEVENDPFSDFFSDPSVSSAIHKATVASSVAAYAHRSSRARARALSSLPTATS